MLRVTVELLPGGSARLRRTLATMSLGNVSELSDISDYDVTALEGANPLAGQPARICGFHVRGHERRQSVWILIAAAIDAMKEAEFTEL